MLSLGLSLSQQGGILLLRDGFGAVYEAVRNLAMPPNLWSYVDSYLPPYSPNWDRCARLVRGAVGLFVEYSWPPFEFVATFAEHEQFERAINAASGSRKGRRYVRGLLNAVAFGLTVNRSQLAVLRTLT
jgi:hypothetical protein